MVYRTMSTNASMPQPVDVTDALARARAQPRDASRERPLRRRSASEEGYGAYELSLSAGWASDYRDIFDFYVNLPDAIPPNAHERSAWLPLRSDITVEQFLELRTSSLRQQLLSLIDGHERILAAYEVSYEHGQLDEVTTWSRARWLLATERSFVFINAYDTTIH